MGEILALQRGDVDLNAGTLSITKGVHNGRVTPPKTTSGRRKVMLSKLALGTLRKHLDEYAGDVWLFQSLVNPGMSIHRSTLHISYWKPLLKAAGLPQHRRSENLPTKGVAFRNRRCSRLCLSYEHGE